MLHKSALLGALALSSLDDIAAYSLFPGQEQQQQQQAKKNKAVLEAITGYVGNQVALGKPLLGQQKIGEDGMFHQAPPEGPIQAQVTGVKAPPAMHNPTLPGDGGLPYLRGFTPKPMTPGNGMGQFIVGSGVNRFNGKPHDGSFESMISTLQNPILEAPYSQLKTAEHTHSHDAILPNGCKLDVFKLIELAKDLPVVKAKLKELKGIDRSKKTGFSEKRLANTDTQYPLLVHKDLVVDGRHRAIKLLSKGCDEAMIKRISKRLMTKAKI